MYMYIYNVCILYYCTLTLCVKLDCACIVLNLVRVVTEHFFVELCCLNNGGCILLTTIIPLPYDNAS